MGTAAVVDIRQLGTRVATGLDAVVVRGFLPPAQADSYLSALLDLAWQQEELVIFGRKTATPRLTAWHGDDGVEYRYSGAEHAARPWTPELIELRGQLAGAVCAPFNFVLANYYRDGNDAMGWHADDEAVLGDAPVIASLSFGATRRLRFQQRADRSTTAVDLDHGSLLVMWGRSQRDWRHSLPRSKACSAQRINLTFRHVVSPA